MGVDVASFGDFFADMRPIGAQVKAVSRVIKTPVSADANSGATDKVTESKALPAVQIAIDESKPAATEPAPVQKRRAQRNDEPIKCLVYKDPFGSTYKKYIFTADGKYLLGGQMIGDTADYVKLVAIVKKKVTQHLVYLPIGY